MSESNSGNGGGGCGCGGCVGIIIFILLFWALWFGLPVGDKTWNIDIFPPRIWEQKDMPDGTTVEVKEDVEATAKTAETSTATSASDSETKKW